MIEFIAGVVIAFAIALTGVGAGTVAAPVMILLLGLDPVWAVGTALLFAFFVKVPVGFLYMKDGLVDYPILGIMSAGGIPGVLAGALFLEKISLYEKLKPLVLIGVGFVILVCVGLNLYNHFLGKKNKGEVGVERRSVLFIVSVFIGFEVGFSSAGAGALGSILLLQASTLDSKRVVATDIVFGLLVSLVGGGLHLGGGNVDFKVLALMLSGALLGVPGGLYLSKRTDGKTLKLILVSWLSLIGLNLIYKGVQIIYNVQ